jgi:hypothetical protein
MKTLTKPTGRAKKPEVKPAKSTAKKTHIAIVLDRSGSMKPLTQEIIGGFNAFLDEQKKAPGECVVTLVQFDNILDRLTDGLQLDLVPPLNERTYVPRGSTKLYDAIGMTINSVKDKPAGAEQFLVLIMTDGAENSSEEYTHEAIQKLLTECQDKGWQFTFVGANQDAIMSARSLGIRNAEQSSLSFAATGQGVNSMMRSVAHATVQCRVSGGPISYRDEDRQAQSLAPHTMAQAQRTATFREHGSKTGQAGGLASSASLAPQQRQERALKAAKARWSSDSVYTSDGDYELTVE